MHAVFARHLIYFSSSFFMQKLFGYERVAKLRFTTRKQIRALAPHAKKLRFSTLANLSVKNPWRMSPDFSDFY